tara:strand:- start:844 stop:1467 length:624 start_codon:yes stop_codon:yes gene_type:complete
MRKPVISIIDYGMGNIWSVSSAIEYLGFKSNILTAPEEIIMAECIVLPGVGSFKDAMHTIKKNCLDVAILESAKKGTNILGICLGMQLLGLSSEEDGLNTGLAIVKKEVKIFDKEKLIEKKIPHIGFNSVKSIGDSKLFKGLKKTNDFYFVHSFKMGLDEKDKKYGECTYGEKFLASFEEDNIFGTQFHPEKSQTNGLKVLKNFLSF